jgi:sporulation protein YlmC with PRC-barrel domain
MLTDDTLHGRTVLSGDGVNLGQVIHLVLDPQGFRIAALEVRLHREVAERIGLSRGILRGPTIKIPTEQVQSIGDAIILAVPVEGLRDFSSTESTAHAPS